MIYYIRDEERSLKGRFNTPYDSMNYHYSTHGSEIPQNNIVNYTNDALDFANRNSDVLQYAKPSRNTMNPGFIAPYSQDYPNGWFTSDGNIFTFWYTKIK